MRDMLPGGILNRQPARRDVPNYLLAHTPRLPGLGKLFRTDCCSKSWISFEISRGETDYDQFPQIEYLANDSRLLSC
jgi:hypothetical protein